MINIKTPAARQTGESTTKSLPASHEDLLPVGCVIMASGLGRRFGGNKLLRDFHGKPLISHIIKKVNNFPFVRRIVVTRHEEIVSLCAQENIPVLLHRLPDKNDTLRLGLQRLLSDTERGTLSGCLFCPADQPLVAPASLEALVLAFSHFPDSICRLGYEDIPGSPVLFGEKYFPELLTLPAGKGGSFLAKKYPGQVKIVPARDKYELYDIDTPEDLAFLSHMSLPSTCPWEAGYLKELPLPLPEQYPNRRK